MNWLLLAQEQSQTPAAKSLADMLAELLAMALAAVSLALVNYVRKYLREKLTTRTMVEALHEEECESCQQAIKARAEKVGVEPHLNKEVENVRATKRLGGGGVAPAILLLGLLFLGGCANIPDAVEQDMLRAQRGFQKVVDDPKASEQEVELGQAGVDLIWAIRYGCGEVSELPADVAQRLAVHGE